MSKENIFLGGSGEPIVVTNENIGDLFSAALAIFERNEKAILDDIAHHSTNCNQCKNTPDNE